MNSLLQCLSVLTETALSCTQSEALLFQLVPVVSHLPTMHHCEKPDSVFLITLRHWRTAIRSMLSLLFSR